MAGIQVPIVADVSQSLRATRDLAGGFDAVADSLDDLTRTGDRAGTDVDRSLGRVEDSAQDASRNVERYFRDAFDEVKRTTSRATDDVARTTRADMERASEGVGDLKNNAASNAKEFAASWDGSAQGAADSVQGFIAESLEGFGTLGILGGVALGAIGGALLNSITQASEQSQQRVSDLFDTFREQRNAFLTEESISDEVAKIVKGADDAAIKLDYAKSNAEKLGLPLAVVMRAFAGDSEAAAIYQERIAAAQAATYEEFLKVQRTYPAQAAVLNNERTALDDINAQWKARSDEIERAKGLYNTYAQTAEWSEDRAREAVEATREGVRGLRADATAPINIPVTVDLTEARKTIANWRPEVVVNARVGKPQVN